MRGNLIKTSVQKKPDFFNSFIYLLLIAHYLKPNPQF